MKAIRNKVCFLALAVGFSVLVSAFIFLQEIKWVFNKNPFLAFTIVITILLCSMLIMEYRKLNIARLIIDNRIMHIQPAKIETGIHGKSNKNVIFFEGIEVFISCFGILINSQVIKFNLQGIYLKEVEIGFEHITLYYGTEKRTQKTQILHEKIEMPELKHISERFRYETGVIPVIID